MQAKASGFRLGDSDNSTTPRNLPREIQVTSSYLGDWLEE
jgi:hypothetical protein